LFLLAGCSEDVIKFPQADTFYIEAVVPSSYGDYVFDAIITETYTEFTSENLKTPVRFENETVSCDETKAEIIPNYNSLFRLSELFSKLFSGENTFRYFTDDDCIIFETEIDNQIIKIKADAETHIPSMVFTKDTTIAINKIELNEP